MYKSSSQIIFLCGFLLISFISCKKDSSDEVPVRKGDTLFLGSTVYSILTDDEGEVWIGTDVGVSRLIDGDFDDTKWINYRNITLPGEKLNDLFIVSSGTQRYLWVATTRGLSKFIIEGDSLTFQLADASGIMEMPLEYNAITAALPGQYLFATENGPVFLTNNIIRTDSFGIKLNNSGRYIQSKIEGKEINNIGFYDGDCYFLMNGNGMYKAYRSASFADSIDGFTSCTEWEEPYANVADTMYAFCQVNDTTLWFGGKNGAFNTVSHYPTYANKRIRYTTELVNIVVRSISGDADGRIWFGTEGGISILDGTTWSTFTTADGLAGDTVYALQYFEGKMLAGTDGGLTVVSME